MGLVKSGRRSRRVSYIQSCMCHNLIASGPSYDFDTLDEIPNDSVVIFVVRILAFSLFYMWLISMMHSAIR